MDKTLFEILAMLESEARTLTADERLGGTS